MHLVHKIVIIGPESTGKSTLSEQLAQTYKCSWCPEYAREYLLKHGMNYSFEDLLTIAKGQITLEDQYLEQITNGQLAIETNYETSNVSGLPTTDSRLPSPGSRLFIDTDLYVMKVWSEFVFGKCDQWILSQIAQRKYDLYLLCSTDLPWVKDELREYPDLESREKLFHIYKDILINQQVPWVEITGNYEQRLSIAIDAVDQTLN
jgi:nicotinamide riboside kinase